MRNAGFQETQVVSDALGRVAALLPTSWRLHQGPGRQADRLRTGAKVKLIGPNKATIPFIVEFRRSGATPTPLLLAALRETQRTTGMQVLYVSDYIGPTTRDALTSQGLSFADATGWVRVISDDPLVLLTGQGAARTPRAPRTTAVTRLNGLASSRIVRALATAHLPVGVRALAGLADVSAGSVSKLLATLTSEGIVDRQDGGKVVAVRRRALLRRWVADYSFTRANPSVGHFIAPRGLERTLARLDGKTGVALTGSAAARRLLPESSTSVVPLRLLALYATRPRELAGELQLIQAEPSIANVHIAQPLDPEILRPSDDGGPSNAPLPLVVADLLTLPGRSDAEAEQLMDALAITDDAWKT
ncbi:helix-turn-helix domain-containing protein [Isoptericola croceus]|uniref:helix-turn-helix domain-containing protein n=1 Tax=Isoptericola croceus TaxID=3031406 RepID=UPI0023F969B9|nr:helix-turn-helix domain-containing protein [Isoptericola croceus]